MCIRDSRWDGDFHTLRDVHLCTQSPKGLTAMPADDFLAPRSCGDGRRAGGGDPPRGGRRPGCCLRAAVD
eukprot:9220855-Alexandrium_andersonii.AAC.1